tara:strand:- start:140 stop:331 length:192 start_codon:yes stop_codon:yes gene_type:complete
MDNYIEAKKTILAFEGKIITKWLETSEVRDVIFKELSTQNTLPSNMVMSSLIIELIESVTTRE